ncbi:MAG: ribulose-phosphate 3-epimerase [Clostridium sp.]|nr:ribulose-phosphate 3-epimerase [Clostridium sp.]
MLIAPSILASDFSRLGEQIQMITQAGADWIHLDVMDGLFVPNITFGAPVIKAVKPYSDLPFDVHLMIQNPKRYIEDFCKAGADIISFHVEAEEDVIGTIEKIVACGAKPALAVKPNTSVETVFPYLDKLYMVLVMTVEPGFGGQKYMADMMPKVEQLKQKAPHLLVQVDGGIGVDTIASSAKAGVDICVAGTSVFRASCPKQMIADLKRAAEDV